MLSTLDYLLTKLVMELGLPQRALLLAASHEGSDLLRCALLSGSAAAVRRILALGEKCGYTWSLTTRGSDGLTPLHLAAVLPDADSNRTPSTASNSNSKSDASKEGSLARALLSFNPIAQVAAALQWFTLLSGQEAVAAAAAGGSSSAFVLGSCNAPAAGSSSGATPAELAELTGKHGLNHSILAHLAQQYLLDCGVRFAMYGVLLKSHHNSTSLAAAAGQPVALSSSPSAWFARMSAPQ